MDNFDNFDNFDNDTDIQATLTTTCTTPGITKSMDDFTYENGGILIVSLRSSTPLGLWNLVDRKKNTSTMFHVDLSSAQCGY